LIRERHSFNIEDAPGFGLSYDSLEDASLYWSVQDYTHEKVEALSVRLSETFQIWLDRDQYLPRYAQVRRGQQAAFGRVVDPNLDCHAMTEVHIQTYRTANYLLSCAQDYRPGKPGYQQHPWQATLGIDAVVFTNHPGSADLTARPNFWAGNGILPRVVQHHNVLVCLHRVWPEDAFPFTHAYFPRDAFDEVVEQDHWIFARKGDGYIGLYVQQPHRWLPDEQGRLVEVRADAEQCVWLVEMGERGQWPDFAGFVAALGAARVECGDLSVQFESPSQGLVEFAWQGDLRVAGQPLALHTYPRFDNPYSHTPFTAPRIEITRGGEQVVLDFEA
jgi:hypothetical protein